MNQEGKTPSPAVGICSFEHGSFDSCKIVVNVTHVGQNFGPLFAGSGFTADDSMEVEDIAEAPETGENNPEESVCAQQPPVDENSEGEDDEDEDEDDSEDEDEDSDSDESDTDYF